MKKIILAIGILFATLTASANTMVNDSTRYLASTLGQNWFVSLNGSVNWWQGSDRIPAGNFTSLNGPSFGGGVSVGKWITHNLALRLTYDVNRGKSFINGRHDNLTYLHFLYVDRNQPINVVQDGVAHQYFETSFMYHNIHGDVLISPVDLILGYYDNRFYTPIIVMGMGLGCVSEYALVTQSIFKDEAKNFELSFNAGLINKLRMNKNFDLDLGFMLSGQRWTIDSWTYEYGASAGNGGIRPKIADLNYMATLGLTWNLSGSDEYGSRIYELPNNYSNEMREMRERIKTLEDDLDECLRNHPTDTVFIHDGGTTDTIVEFASYPLSIFFRRDSYQLMSKRDLINLQEIARVAIEKGWLIRLRGSCDSATATPEYNQRLSENRCNKIKLELMDMGVPENRFVLIPVGGVKELDPTEFDRRVIIEFVKAFK